MASLSDYHWLFADELAPGDAHFPTFVPRILDFEEPSDQSRNSTFSNTSPSLSPDESRVPESPIFTSEDDSDLPWVTSGSEFSTNFSSLNHSQRGCLSPAQNILFSGLKRRNDFYHEEHPRKRRHPRSPVYDPTCTFDVAENRAPSPIYIASTSINLSKSKIDPCLSTYHHSHQPQISTDVPPRFEERNPQQDLTELYESKRCIKFLIEEMNKIIESNRYGVNSQITHRTIKRTEQRLKSFIQTSHIMSQIVAEEETDESCVGVTEDINTYNPFLYRDDKSATALFKPKCLNNPFHSTSSCCAAPSETCRRALLLHGETSSSCSENSNTTSNNTAFSQTIASNAALQNDLTSSLVDNSNRFAMANPLGVHYPVPRFFSNVCHHSSNNLVDHNFHSTRNIYI